MKITARHYDAALKLANEARKRLGRRPVKRLKKGQPGEPQACVIANTIGADVYVWPNHVDRNGIVVTKDQDEEDVIVKGGRAAQVFALAFDSGDIPELVS